jgi:Tfp pilus assembly protein PilN
MALGLLCLLAPALWFGFNLYKVQLNIDQLREQQALLQRQAAPVLQARSQALDYLARINALHALARYPDQLTLMGRIAEVLPKNAYTLKDWDFSAHQLKITLSAATDVPATPIIDVLQKAGPFSDVKALPGRDPKSVMFQMNVVAK